MVVEKSGSLSVGTEVSAKYRGAFCEAKVKSVDNLLLKCKVLAKPSLAHHLVLSDDIEEGNLNVGENVHFKIQGKKLEGTIQAVFDLSTYTVVFNDGDLRTLKRTQLVLKGNRHFNESDSLDKLPLTNPEHLGGSTGNKRRKKQASESSEEVPQQRRKQQKSTSFQREKWVGDAVFVKMGSGQNKRWFPGLVCLPNSNSELAVKNNQVLVKSFKDNRFVAVDVKELREFVKEKAQHCGDRGMRTALEKAILWHEDRELPHSWVKSDLVGSDSESDGSGDISKDACSQEEQDYWTARLYNFMDDRNTPIIKTPAIGTTDLDLFRFYNVVKRFGGFNKVSSQMKWLVVSNRMGLSPTSSSSLIRSAYLKYLMAFEDFDRKLGSSINMGGSSARSRNFLSAREKSHTTLVSRRSSSSSSVHVKKVPTPVVSVSESGDQPEPASVKSEVLSESSSICNENGSCTNSKDASETDRSLSSSKLACTEGSELYDVDMKVKVRYGDPENLKVYEARIVEKKPAVSEEDKLKYHVHYFGWNTRYDEEITADRIICLSDGVTPGIPNLGFPIHDRESQASSKSKSRHRTESESTTSTITNLSRRRKISINSLDPLDDAKQVATSSLRRRRRLTSVKSEMSVDSYVGRIEPIDCVSVHEETDKLQVSGVDSECTEPAMRDDCSQSVDDSLSMDSKKQDDELDADDEAGSDLDDDAPSVSPAGSSSENKDPKESKDGEKADVDDATPSINQPKKKRRNRRGVVFTSTSKRQRKTSGCAVINLNERPRYVRPPDQPFVSKYGSFMPPNLENYDPDTRIELLTEAVNRLRDAWRSEKQGLAELDRRFRRQQRRKSQHLGDDPST